MKRFLVHSLAVSSLAFMAVGLNAQVLSNSGATLTIEPGALLKIEGGIENVSGGTINNQGILEVQGDFDNAATYTGTADTVRFSGSANSQVTSNGAVFGTVLIEKDATKNVVLVDQATVGAELEFVNDDNKVLIGDNDLVLQDGASFDSFDDNEFVVTDGAGYVKIQGIANGDSETYPVGGSNTRYNPIALSGNAGNTTDEYGINANDYFLSEGMTGDTLDETVVDASWVLIEGTAGGMDIDVTPSWFLAHETMNFDADSSAVGLHNGDGWDLAPADFGAANGGEPNSRDKLGVSEEGVLAVSGAGDGIVPPAIQGVKVELKAFLAGPYAAGVMSDALRANPNDLIPLIEPYAGSPYNYVHTLYGGDEPVAQYSDFASGGAGNEVVDWVLVEVRDIADSTTVIASKSALIQKDGDIVDVDGQSTLFIPGVAAGDYIVSVNHRNHLGVRTPVSLSLDNVTPAAYDFTTAADQAYTDGSIENAAQRDMGDGNFALWDGDANQDDLVSYNVGFSDRIQILLEVGFSTPNQVLTDVYNRADVQMNTDVAYNVGFSDRISVLLAVGFSTPNNVLYRHN